MQDWGWAAPQVLGQNPAYLATTAGDNLPREEHSFWLRGLAVDKGSESEMFYNLLKNLFQHNNDYFPCLTIFVFIVKLTPQSYL